MAAKNDEPDGPRTNGTGAATDQPPRTVAEEAALLVDLLSRRGWGASSGMPSSSSSTPAAEAPAAGTPAAEMPAPGADAPPGGDAAVGSECTCGGRQPAACGVCPVCQLISFVQQVNPETIERVADFVGFAATALRDLATAQRERADRPRSSGAEPDGPT